MFERGQPEAPDGLDVEWQEGQLRVRRPGRGGELWGAVLFAVAMSVAIAVPAISSDLSLILVSRQFGLSPGARVLRGRGVNAGDHETVPRTLRVVSGGRRFDLSLGMSLEEETWIADALNRVTLERPGVLEQGAAPGVIRSATSSERSGFRLALKRRPTPAPVPRIQVLLVVVAAETFLAWLVSFSDSGVSLFVITHAVVAVSLGIAGVLLASYRVTSAHVIRLERDRLRAHDVSCGLPTSFVDELAFRYIRHASLDLDPAHPRVAVHGSVKSVELAPAHDLGTAVEVGRLVVAELRRQGVELTASWE